MNHPIMSSLRLCCIGLLFLAACHSSTAPGPAADVFLVHLESQFSSTPVTVTIDGNSVFSDTVTTNPLLGLAKAFRVPIMQGMHAFTVKVSNAPSKDTIFTITDTLYAWVAYDSAGAGVTCGFTRRRPLYDRIDPQVFR